MNKTISNIKGFTFVEVLIAIAILALGFIGLTAMSGNAVRGVDSAKKLSAATNLAETKLEALKAVPYTNLEVSHTDGGITRTCTPPSTTVCGTVYTCTPTTAGAHSNPENINNVNYTWSWTVTIPDIDSSGTCTSSGDGLKKITMTAAWTDTFGSRTAALQTLMAQ